LVTLSPLSTGAEEYHKHRAAPPRSPYINSALQASIRRALPGNLLQRVSFKKIDPGSLLKIQMLEVDNRE
jgi:hypothetical protein